jgi:hypothetical protein
VKRSEGVLKTCCVMAGCESFSVTAHSHASEAVTIASSMSRCKFCGAGVTLRSFVTSEIVNAKARLGAVDVNND